MSNMISLAERMKGYENIPKNFLMRRTPVIIRLDGAHFKNFTRTLDKPFDGVLTRAMEGTLLYLCKTIQGCVFGYTQSDEIVFLLSGNNPIYNYSIEDMCSVIGSTISVSFYSIFLKFLLFLS